MAPEALLTIPPQYEHQRVTHDILKAEDAYLLNWDMGCGKSRAIVDLVCDIGAKLTLIVCPHAVVPHWPQQFATFGDETVRMLTMLGTANREAKNLCREIDCVKATDYGRLCVVTNYQKVWRSDLGDLIKRTHWDLIVADEIHRIKANRGKASMFFAQLTRVSNKRIGLSGTPMAHSPLDVWAQFRFLDPSVFQRTFTQFRATYAVLNSHLAQHLPRGAYPIAGYQNLDDLNKRFFSMTSRVKKEDVLDLPPATHQKIEVELCPAARKIYRELETNFYAAVDSGEITAANAAVKLMRLGQITGGHATVENDDRPDHIEQIDVSKNLALSGFLSDLDMREPVVVFCQFSADVASVKNVAYVEGRKAYELSGNSKQLAEWQDRPSGNGDVLAVQIQSGGEGIDLTRAAYCVYYSTGYSLGSYQQSLARLHRPGQKRPVTYVHLVARDTVDEKVYAALAAGKNVIDSILDWRPE